MMKQDAIMQGESPHTEARLDNLTWGKESQRKAKERPTFTFNSFQQIVEYKEKLDSE